MIFSVIYRCLNKYLTYRKIWLQGCLIDDTQRKHNFMISQQQTQKQQLKILPQQIQLLNLYFLNTIELEQRIKNEMEENPLLEAMRRKSKRMETQSYRKMTCRIIRTGMNMVMMTFLIINQNTRTISTLKHTPKCP